jgi:cytochrome c oxidase cbb3-type subunit III
MTFTKLVPAVPVAVVASVMVLAACGGNRSSTGRMTDSADQPAMVQQLSLVPGPAVDAVPAVNPFDGDSVAFAEGRRLYGWFNCGGCHFEGGGGIGPALMDRAWVYGSTPEQIFDSIASGRANGMPSYGTRLTTDQIWKIALYVESLEAAADEAEGNAAR